MATVEEHTNKSRYRVHRGMLTVGVVLFLGGIVGALGAQEMALWHPSHGRKGEMHGPVGPDHLSKEQARTYGFVTAAIGIFVIRFAFTRRSE